MNKASNSTWYRPLLYGAIVFVLFLIITQFIAYQRYRIIKSSERDALKYELNSVVSRFREILDHKISSANTIAIIYNQDKHIGNFESIAKQILAYDPSIDFINLTDRYIMKYVYPMEGNDMILGHSLLEVPLFSKELELAVKNRQVLFAGPYPLTNNRGQGIACRIPIFINDSFCALVTVVTKLPTIAGHIPQFKNENKRTVFRISKENPVTGNSEHYFDGFDPGDNEVIKEYMPEGNWRVEAAYFSGYNSPNDAFVISIIGVLFSFVIGMYVYNRTRLPIQLEEVVTVKTHELGERIKELSTIYLLNEILKDDRQSAEHVFNQIVDILPKGWQYPEDCAARIVFDGEEYTTVNFTQSVFNQAAPFELIDGRKGFIEVLYTKEKPGEYEGCFLKEERDLINAIADTITIYFNKAIQQRILVESEARFRGAFEDAAIGMAIVSVDGIWLKVNKSLCEIVGYTEDEMKAMNFQQITHADDLAIDIEYLGNVSKGTQDVLRAEKRYYHKNGQLVWVNLNVTVVRDATGSPLYFIAQIENITDKVESQMRFRNLVEESLVGVYIVQEGKLVYANPRLREESGYSEEELVGSDFTRFIHPDDLPVVLSNMQARLKGEVHDNRYETRIIKKDGGILWLEIIATTTIINGQPALIGTLVNITEKKNAYMALEKSAANLQSIFDTTNVSYVLLDADARIVSFNDYWYKGYKEQTGIDVQEGAYFIDCLMPDKKDNATAVLSKVKEELNTVTYEAEYTNRDITKYYYMQVSPVLNKGVFIGYCYSGMDITDRKKLELERQEIINDLVQRNKDLEQFAHILSHNVRAPLSTILGLSSLIKEEQDESERVTIIDGMEHSAKQLDVVINDLNEILHIKRDISELKNKVRLSDVVEEVKHMLAIPIATSGVTIETDFTEADNIKTVRSYMHSIIYNLVYNAIKYRRTDVASYIKISTEKPDGEIRIRISDNGMGFDMKKHGEQLFGLYKRFHPDIDGKGMGLFMVKTQVDALKGTIRAVSVVGEGTEFILTFDA